jgi:site-specific recombinase XerD
MDDHTKTEKNLVPNTAADGMLTRQEFQQLADVLAEVEWFANIDNSRTRRAYQIDLRDFMQFVGIRRPEEFRLVTRAHLIAWRKQLEQRQLAGATIRRKLAALSSVFEYLCVHSAVTNNPVKGVKRPTVESYEGKTPALGDHQARALLNAPDAETLKGKRDRAMLSTLLYHGLRREELCTLKVRDITQRRGVLHLRVHGKGSKLRYLPLHPGTAEVITDYVDAVGHGTDPSAPLFRPVRNNRIGYWMSR